MVCWINFLGKSVAGSFSVHRQRRMRVCWFVQVMNEAQKQLKSAPPDSLTYRLAVCFAIINSNHGGLRAIAHLWQVCVLSSVTFSIVDTVKSPAKRMVGTTQLHFLIKGIMFVLKQLEHVYPPPPPPHPDQEKKMCASNLNHSILSRIYFLRGTKTSPWWTTSVEIQIE